MDRVPCLVVVLVVLSRSRLCTLVALSPLSGFTETVRMHDAELQTNDHAAGMWDVRCVGTTETDAPQSPVRAESVARPESEGTSDSRRASGSSSVRQRGLVVGRTRSYHARMDHGKT